MKKSMMIVLLSVAGISFGTNLYWQNGATDGGLWTNADNWNGSVPTSSDSARIQGGQPGPQVTSGMFAVAGELLLAWGGGKVNTLYLTGGSLSVGGVGITHIGYSSGDDGTLDISGGVFTNSGSMNIGLTGSGTLTMSGGEASANGTLFVAKNAGSSGHIQLDGGSLYALALSMDPSGSALSATLDITDGTLILAGNDSTVVQGYINAGLITAFGYSSSDAEWGVIAEIVISYDSEAGKTYVTAVSDPVGSNIYWLDGATDGGLWTNSANWSAGVPQINDSVRIRSGQPGPKVMDGMSAAAGELLLAWGGGETNTLYLEGGVLTVGGGGNTHIAYHAADNGTLDISGGIFTNSGSMNVGLSGEGTLALSGGEAAVNGTLFIAKNAGSTGLVQLDGGTLSALALSMDSSGSALSASIDITEGTLILDGDDSAVVQGYVDSGLITAFGYSSSDPEWGAGVEIIISYDSGEDKTYVTADGSAATAATIVEVSVAAEDVLKLVVDARGLLSGYFPEYSSDLVSGSWSNIAHADAIAGSYVVTNLDYSVAGESNTVIYVQSQEPVGFFRIVTE